MPTALEICILAGGLSTRMGRAKSRLRLGNLTLLGCVRRNAAALRLPVRVIRKDLVRRCGPLGGLYTALKTTRAFAVLFLPCDTPFISAPSLRRCLAVFDGERPVFALSRGQPAFPIILPVAVLPIVKSHIDVGRFALHQLARATAARRVRLPARDLFNVNTPEDFARARKRQSRNA